MDELGLLARWASRIEYWGPRVHRARTLLRARARASASHASIEITIHPTARLRGPLDITVTPGSANALVIGPRTRVARDVSISLRGGSVRIGADGDVRPGAYMQAEGRLEVGDRVLVANGVGLMAAERVVIGDDTLLSHGSLVVDSNHVRTGRGDPVWHEITRSPVHVGENVWVGAGVVITAGADVADQCVVAANAVVTGAHEPSTLVAGIPATSVRALADGEPLGG